MGLSWSAEADVFRDCCCDVKLVIVASKNIEHVLTTDFGASGRGLHEKITSVEDLPPFTKRKLRKIATIRNKLIHEVGYDAVENPEEFKREFREAINELRLQAQAKGKPDPFNSCTVQ